jgi:hypothetical protein
MGLRQEGELARRINKIHFRFSPLHAPRGSFPGRATANEVGVEYSELGGLPFRMMNIFKRMMVTIISDNLIIMQGESAGFVGLLVCFDRPIHS